MAEVGFQFPTSKIGNIREDEMEEHYLEGDLRPHASEELNAYAVQGFQVKRGFQVERPATMLNRDVNPSGG